MIVLQVQSESNKKYTYPGVQQIDPDLPMRVCLLQTLRKLQLLGQSFRHLKEERHEDKRQQASAFFSGLLRAT
jgi:hypothetical protein